MFTGGDPFLVDAEVVVERSLHDVLHDDDALVAAPGDGSDNVGVVQLDHDVQLALHLPHVLLGEAQRVGVPHRFDGHRLPIPVRLGQHPLEDDAIVARAQGLLPANLQVLTVNLVQIRDVVEVPTKKTATQISPFDNDAQSRVSVFFCVKTHTD